MNTRHQMFPEGWLRSIEIAARGTVQSLIGNRFDSYARILHPATAPDGGNLRWSQVAHASGFAFDPARSSWYDISQQTLRNASARGRRTLWDAPPEEGLPSTIQHVLLGILSDTQGLEDSLIAYVEHIGDSVLRGPGCLGIVEIHHRRFGVYQHDQPLQDKVLSPNPNMWWSAKAGWLVVSDYDLPCSYVGGSSGLVERILADPRLECAVVTPDTPFHEEV